MATKVTNIYTLLDESAAPAAKPAAPAPQQKQAAPAAKPAQQKQQQQQKPKAEKGGDFTEVRGNQNNQRQQQKGQDRKQRTQAVEPITPVEGAKESRPARPRAAARGVDTHGRPRGREFERHSGTGRGREIKKGGAGVGNWGKAGEESDETQRRPRRNFNRKPAAAEEPAEAEAPAPVEAAAAAPAAAEEAKPEEPKELTPEELERKKEEEEAAKQKTLDQYLAELKAKKPKVPKKAAAPRAANEGDVVIDAKWKDAQPLTRDADETFIKLAKEQKKKEGEKKTSSKPKPQAITEFLKDLPETASRPQRREGGRGPRQQGGKPQQKRGNAPNVNDQSAFPSLSKK